MMEKAAKAPDVELFGNDSVDDIIVSIEGKADQIGVVLDLLYPYFTHIKPGRRELTEIQWDFAKIRTLIEIASDALKGIADQADRWNEMVQAIHAKHEQEKEAVKNGSNQL